MDVVVYVIGSTHVSSYVYIQIADDFPLDYTIGLSLLAVTLSAIEKDGLHRVTQSTVDWIILLKQENEIWTWQQVSK